MKKRKIAKIFIAAAVLSILYIIYSLFCGIYKVTSIQQVSLSEPYQKKLAAEYFGISEDDEGELALLGCDRRKNTFYIELTKIEDTHNFYFETLKKYGFTEEEYNKMFAVPIENMDYDKGYWGNTEQGIKVKKELNGAEVSIFLFKSGRELQCEMVKKAAPTDDVRKLERLFQTYNPTSNNTETVSLYVIDELRLAEKNFGVSPREEANSVSLDYNKTENAITFHLRSTKIKPTETENIYDIYFKTLSAYGFTEEEFKNTFSKPIEEFDLVMDDYGNIRRGALIKRDLNGAEVSIFFYKDGDELFCDLTRKVNDEDMTRLAKVFDKYKM